MPGQAGHDDKEPGMTIRQEIAGQARDEGTTGMEGGKNKKVRHRMMSDLRKTAATYSPTWWGSTIGDGELNFSVRNGKRWFLTAITAAYIT